MRSYRSSVGRHLDLSPQERTELFLQNQQRGGFC